MYDYQKYIRIYIINVLKLDKNDKEKNITNIAYYLKIVNMMYDLLYHLCKKHKHWVSVKVRHIWHWYSSE